MLVQKHLLKDPDKKTLFTGKAKYLGLFFFLPYLFGRSHICIPFFCSFQALSCLAKEVAGMETQMQFQIALGNLISFDPHHQSPHHAILQGRLGA